MSGSDKSHATEKDVGYPPTDLKIDRDLSRMFLIVPIEQPLPEQPDTGITLKIGSTQHSEPLDFTHIDADVDLPKAFFTSFQRWTQITQKSTIQISDTREQKYEVVVDRIEVLAVGTGTERMCFLAAKLLGRSDNLADWLHTARLAGKIQNTQKICHQAGSTPLTDDTNGTVLTALYVTGQATESDLKQTTLHLATRAPAGDHLDIANAEEVGGKQLSKLRYRVVTKRTCGFVLGDHSTMNFYQDKFPLEIEWQYLLAVALNLWQTAQLHKLLERSNDAWDAHPSQGSDGFVTRIRSIRGRASAMEELRPKYSRLVGTGVFGPVFGSGTQGRFWAELQGVTRTQQLRNEVQDALSALGQATETQASLSMERLLAFFTLVIGVPSLAFTVLGVNIDRLTSDSGLAGGWVITLLLVCLIAGAAAFLTGNGTPRSRRRRNDQL